MLTTVNAIALIGFASTLLGIIIQSWIAIRVATLNRKIQEVHIAVNSERTSLLLRFDELAAKYNLLLGASAQRAETAGRALATTPTNEPTAPAPSADHQAEGADQKAPG